MRVVLGHQPVMDMAPRWAGGWGFQFRYETLGSNKLLDGRYSNAGLSHYRNTTWFEGVYTWKRSIRATFKLPYHQIKNEKQLIDWGDPIEKGYGLAWQGQMRPCAFTNPIFVDIDGAGFEPNGDTLDDTLPTGLVPPPTSGK